MSRKETCEIDGVTYNAVDKAIDNGCADCAGEYNGHICYHLPNCQCSKRGHEKKWIYVEQEKTND